MDVTVFTNYPRNVIERFGVPRQCARSFLWHGLMSRAAGWFDGSRRFEPALHQSFSRWAAQTVPVEGFDSVHCFSGVAEELFQSLNGRRVRKTLIRGSAHIEIQARLLEDERERTGLPLEVPSAWMIAREKREYELADGVLVLSTFARQTFIDSGFPEQKLRLLQLGADLARFRPGPGVIERRCLRILSKRPLRVLTVGTFSGQKGALDLVRIAQALAGKFEFRFVGTTLRETASLRREARKVIEFLSRQREDQLPSFYEWGDLFLFPTIQDGYATVLAQAQAAGLPVLTTTNCAGPDLVIDGRTGWILPIRSPAAFIEKLEHCAGNRESLAAAVRAVYAEFQPRDWSVVARDFEGLCR